MLNVVEGTGFKDSPSVAFGKAYRNKTAIITARTTSKKKIQLQQRAQDANMTSMGNNEFVLTIFGALAQEESANTSKRIKCKKRG